MMKRTFFFVLAVWMVIGLSANLLAGDECTRNSVVQAVDEAVAILEAEGESGLEKIGKIRFCNDNYVFVNDFGGKTLMHIKPHLIGQVLIGLKDDTGKRFFADFTKMAQSAKTKMNNNEYFNGSGWVSYRWPKPGENDFAPKVSYVKGCMMGGQNIYVGAGIYE